LKEAESEDKDFGQTALNRRPLYCNAIQEYEKAAKMDPTHAEHALYNAGYAIIKKYGKEDKDIRNNKMEKASEHFAAAKVCIQTRINELYFFMMPPANEETKPTALGEQTQRRINLSPSPSSHLREIDNIPCTREFTPPLKSETTILATHQYRHQRTIWLRTSVWLVLVLLAILNGLTTKLVVAFL